MKPKFTTAQIQRVWELNEKLENYGELSTMEYAELHTLIRGRIGELDEIIAKRKRRVRVLSMLMIVLITFLLYSIYKLVSPLL